MKEQSGTSSDQRDEKERRVSVTQIQALAHGEVITGTHLLQSRSEKDLTRAGSNECVCVLISCRLLRRDSGVPCVGAAWGLPRRALWRAGVGQGGGILGLLWRTRRSTHGLDMLHRYPVPCVLRSGQGAQRRVCWKGPSIAEVNILI